MTQRIPFICRCGGLVQNGACTGCGPRKKRTGWKDDKFRGTRQERGYDQAWLQTRERKLNKCPLCEMCEANGLVNDAVEVHHVIPFAGLSDPLRLDMNNLQSLCAECHGRITRQRSSARRGGYLPHVVVFP